MNLHPRKRHALNNTMMLAGGNLCSAVLVLARNILIARLISVEDFGIASTFAIAVTLIETGTNLGMDRMIVQDARGGRRRFMASLQTVQVVRGCIGAAFTVAFAHFYASAMGLSGHVWAYQCLALIPLVRGFVNLGIFRAQRVMRFAPFVTASVASNVAAVLAAVPLGLWLGDFRAMLGALLVQQLVMLIVSHVAVSCRFRLHWNLATFRNCLSFGMPLLLNGIVMFAVLNGDQLLVGSVLGMETLGWFAVAYALTLVPATILANTLQSLLLPGLARCRKDACEFARAGWRTLQVSGMCALGLASLMVLVGPAAVDLLFGARYAEAANILPWLAVLQAVRVAKAGPAILSIASAHTRDPLIANLVRLTFLPFAVLWLLDGGAVLAVVLIAIAGESAALSVSILLLVRRGALGSVPRIRSIAHG